MAVEMEPGDGDEQAAGPHGPGILLEPRDERFPGLRRGGDDVAQQPACAQLLGQGVEGHGRVPGGLAAVRPTADGLLEETDTGFGRLAALPHPARLSATPAGWARPSMPPGTHPPAWPHSTA